MSGWLPQPVVLESSRAFDCDGFTPSQCAYYREIWHFWYEADHVYALSTVAFFMCAIGIFIIGNVVNQLLSHSRRPAYLWWRRLIAGVRYLSYRGFHVQIFRWNSASIGLLLLAAAGTIFFFCMDLIPQPYYWPGPDSVWGNSPPLGTRSGWLALACMPFIFATASKANWITLATGVPHEKLQVFHRWIAYAFLVLALMHTFPFIVYHIRNHDMVMQVTMMNTFEYWTGIVALVFQAWLTFASHSFFRKLGYEFFKASHFFSVVVFVLIFFWHCGGTLSSWDYFIATAAVYVPCFLYSWMRTLIEHGGWSDAKVFVEDNGFIRVSIPADFDWVPGQHCFLRFGRFGLRVLSSHPFTICSLPSTTPDEKSQITFYIRHRNGFTARLHNFAQKLPGASVPVLVDGPYGGIDMQKYYSSDRLMVIAGGSGAGWALPFIETFARLNQLKANEEQRSNDISNEKSRTNGFPHGHRNTAGPRSLRVILATRDTPTRVWFRKTVQHLLSRYPSLKASPDFELEVFLTGEADQHSDSPKILADLERSSSSSSSGDDVSSQDDLGDKKDGPHHHAKQVVGDELHGRPRLPILIQEEAARAARSEQSLGVFVCGPDTMQNDARNAAAEANFKVMRTASSGSVYLHLEHFSWA